MKLNGAASRMVESVDSKDCLWYSQARMSRSRPLRKAPNPCFANGGENSSAERELTAVYDKPRSRDFGEFAIPWNLSVTDRQRSKPLTTG